MFRRRATIDPNKLPRHIAFIMDGNGRWARARGMPRTYGHHHGYVKMKVALRRCVDLGIGVVSIYAFSTENWNRPKDELDTIFSIVRDNMERDTKLFNDLGVRVVASGDITKFPEDLATELIKVQEATKNNTRCTLNLCINYGGRADIVRAVNTIVKEGKEITEESFSKYLYNPDLPDPDFIVRTSGEHRISNFMLWQMAYSEFWFPKLHWPAINEKFIDDCILEFQRRNRRYGRV